MTVDELRRSPGALGWLVLGLGAVMAVMAGLGALGFRWDPFNLAERRAARAVAEAEVLTLDRDARAIEAEGAADTAARVEIVQREIRTAETILQHLTIHAEAAHDADATLDPDRLDRLRESDRRLCDVRPALCGPAAAPRDAGDGR